MSQLHKCGTCGREFSDEREYLDHTCKTNYKPTEIEHLDATSDGQFSKQSEAARKRGEARR